MYAARRFPRGEGNNQVREIAMTINFRSLIAATALAGAFVAGPAFADETSAPSEITITGTATVASQYRFRGLSQSDNLPVIQGSITAAHLSGLYVGAWGSSASNNNSPIYIGGTELDVFGGFAHTFADLGVTADAGVYGYIYPGATAGNYYEVYGSLAKTYGPVKAKVGVNYAPAQKVFNINFTTATRNNTYVYGELSSAVPGTPVSVHGHLGHTAGGFDYGKPYLDYSAGVSYTWKALTLDGSVVGTNIGRKDLVGTFGATGGYFNEQAYRQAKTVGVVSLTAAF